MLLVLGIGIFLVLVFAKRTSDKYNNLLKRYVEQSDANRKAMDDLRKIQEGHLAEQAKINQKYREVIQRIENNYRSQLEQLNVEKERDLKALIKANHDNPQEMARQINLLFGLPIYIVQGDESPSN